MTLSPNNCLPKVTLILGFLLIGYNSAKNENGVVISPKLEDIIRGYGYPYENHTVTTDDGWILTTGRIPNKASCTQKKGTILLAHGIYNNGAAFVYLGPHKSIGLMLADQCYDVWLANARATRYTKHKKYTKKDKEFWNFSFDDLAMYDTAALIKYITHTTGEHKIHYIGYSQGTTQILALLSRKPEFQKQIQSLHLIAPVAFARGITHYPKLLPVSAITESLMNTPEAFYRAYPDPNYVVHNMVFETCRSQEARLRAVCEFTMRTYFGQHGEDTWVIHFPEPISLKILGQYVQQFIDDDFQMYNYGPQKNLELYGTIKQPSYPLEKMQSPTYIYNSLGDDYSTEVDVNRLVQRLPNIKLHHYINSTDFAHPDFLGFSQKTVQNFHHPLFNVLQQL